MYLQATKAVTPSAAPTLPNTARTPTSVRRAVEAVGVQRRARDGPMTLNKHATFIAKPFTAPRASVAHELLIVQKHAVYALDTAHRYTILCPINAARRRRAASFLRSRRRRHQDRGDARGG